MATLSVPATSPSMTSNQVEERILQLLMEQSSRFDQLYPKLFKSAAPESIRQLRVTLRKLGSLVEGLTPLLQLPKGLDPSRIRRLRNLLGSIRDVDVEIETLQTLYRPQINPPEQHQLDRLIARLKHIRQHRLQTTRTQAPRKRWVHVQKALHQWGRDPTFTPVTQMDPPGLVPDLLTPRLAEFLLHSAWWIPLQRDSHRLTAPEYDSLHDLRKKGKRLRYQAEALSPWFGLRFQHWIQELATLQETLGRIHDLHGLALLTSHHLPQLESALEQEQQQTWMAWETLRQSYRDPGYREALHTLVLNPNPSEVSTPRLRE